MRQQRMPGGRWDVFALLLLAVVLGGAPASAATLTLFTNSIGATPDLLAYNSGHFFTNSNTKDWWRYSGVSGARVFVSPSDIEASDDNPPTGDGVTDQASFVARKAALRADPLNPTYIDWAYFSNRYETVDLGASGGNNRIRVNYCFREMRKLGIQICAQITASASRFPISGDADWPNKWELWQHYYAQAFYLGRTFDVQRYQMYNEPDAVPLATDDFLRRLQLASDAVQSAIADVNALYGKSLTPLVLAPVNAGNASSDYNGGLGGAAVTNRHANYLGVTDTNWFNLHRYDYHQYSGGPSGFASDLFNLRTLLTTGMAPEPPFKQTCSEFNTHTGATFDTLTETLDTPAEYADLGGICVALMANGCSELYMFKFSQTERTGGTYPVAKNATHYVDNNNSPYNVGGITRAGEVYRLFNKAFAPGRSRISTSKGSGATSFEVHASYDAARKRYYFYSVNDTASDVAIDFAMSTVPVPVGNRVLLEEVSESNYGAGQLWTTLPAGKTVSAGTQRADTVWLLTVPIESQAGEQIVTATDDAEVRDGANKTVNYGSATTMTARNDPASTANRSAALMKFNLTGLTLTNLEFALLSFQASSATSNLTAQAHVYALATNGWTQGGVTWSNAPNLRQNLGAGNTILYRLINGAGDTANIVGQVVTTSTNATEKLIDVTDWLRASTNSSATFLVAQEPRWDVELPSLDTGDTQPTGVRILTTESANGPRLRLVFKGVASTNTPPLATNDAHNATEDVPFVVGAPGVLTNDFDADTNALTAVLVVGPANGALSLNPNGGFTYTPATNFNGADSFTYKANDGLADSGVATVSISVAAVNDPPVAQNDIATTTQNVAVVTSPLANDSDVDGGTPAIVSFTQGASGSVSNSGGGTLTYSPNLNFTGGDSFNYTITDGQGGTNTASVSITVNAATGGAPYWTNLVAATEAFVRGGTSGASDQDEATLGYLMVKYNASPFDTSRKTYLQFDLAGLNVNTSTQATLTVGFVSSFQQRVQLWGLNQSYAGFNAGIVWNSAQANDTNSNDLLITGPFTAGAIGASAIIPVSGTTPYQFAVSNIAPFIQGNRVTFALSAVNDAANNASGLRMMRTNATLQLQVVPPAPLATNPPVITSIVLNSNRTVTMNFLGTAGAVYRVQGATNLPALPWLDLSTNLAGTNGTWQFTDPAASNLPARYYRAVTP